VLWDLDSGKSIRVFEDHLEDDATALAITPDGRHVLSGHRGGALRLWNLETGQTILSLDGRLDSVLSVAILRGGRRALSASSDHTLRLWKLDIGKPIRPRKADTKEVNAVAVSKNHQNTLDISDAD